MQFRKVESIKPLNRVVRAFWHAWRLKENPNILIKKGIEMPKLKTKSAAKTRFSVTGTGKLKRNFAKKRHCLFCKTQKMKRQARGTTLVADVDVQIVKQFMPYL